MMLLSIILYVGMGTGMHRDCAKSGIESVLYDISDSHGSISVESPAEEIAVVCSLALPQTIDFEHEAIRMPSCLYRYDIYFPIWSPPDVA
ncbi:MAG: hypothetical protein QM786_06450 [Breznakibacter sp.]